MSWLGVLRFYIAIESRKRQRESDRLTPRVKSLISAKNSANFSVRPSPCWVPARSAFPTNKTGRWMQASHQNTRQPGLETSHIIRLSISYKVASDIACSCSQAIFPALGNLPRECWLVASRYDAILRALIEVSSHKKTNQKNTNSYGYRCSRYRITCLPL